MKPPETLETARLQLRKPRMEDAEIIFEQYAQDPEVTRFLTWRPHESIDVTRTFLQRCLFVWEQGSAFPMSIVRREDGHMMGMVEMRIDGHKAEFGYGIARHYWGQGYMSEAVRALVEWALNQPQIYRVGAICDIENAGSARVMEKAGMQREGILRRWIYHPNRSDEPRDVYVYSMVK
jgi:ribosomal-protein-alanine N-acetyltransferase